MHKVCLRSNWCFEYRRKLDGMTICDNRCSYEDFQHFYANGDPNLNSYEIKMIKKVIEEVFYNKRGDW